MVPELESMLLLHCKDGQICKYLVFLIPFEVQCWRESIENIEHTFCFPTQILHSNV